MAMREETPGSQCSGGALFLGGWGDGPGHRLGLTSLLPPRACGASRASPSPSPTPQILLGLREPRRGTLPPGGRGRLAHVQPLGRAAQSSHLAGRADPLLLCHPSVPKVPHAL